MLPGIRDHRICKSDAIVFYMIYGIAICKQPFGPGYEADLIKITSVGRKGNVVAKVFDPIHIKLSRIGIVSAMALVKVPR